AVPGQEGDLPCGGRAVATNPDDDMVTEAVDAARRADVAVLFLGLPSATESEGFDRTDIELPADQIALLEAVHGANPNTVVVLANGGVVSIEPWKDHAAAILEGWLLGQAGGSAIADLLFGITNPSGRLTETIPLRLQDNPSYLHFPGSQQHVRYGEGLYVGYRYYDSALREVAYPFGFGPLAAITSCSNPTTFSPSEVTLALVMGLNSR
ncbi:glycoside hydrolase family 3 C-terminal domain-containing protein, partial [Streptomyces sp. NPDC002130]|uniref:glycoside hydrolase family 3 protein n=1 Tax=Streptomyces sp. NPDC002130 TaxID=3155568 RepID=UPI00332446CA